MRNIQKCNLRPEELVPIKPWLRKKVLKGEVLKEQLEWHHYIETLYDCMIPPSAYIAPTAKIICEDGGSFQIGEESWIASDCILRGDIQIGNHCSFNLDVISIGKITIGDGVRIAARSQLIGFTHNYDDLDEPIFKQGTSQKGIIIEDDVWVGANVIILDGVRVGAHSILAAGAVVTKNVPPFSIVGGTPAKLIRCRKKNHTYHYGQISSSLEGFFDQVEADLDFLLEDSYIDGEFVDRTFDQPCIVAWCQALELMHSFGKEVKQVSTENFVDKLQSFQDPETGLLFTNPWSKDGHLITPQSLQGDYGILCVGYALEILNAKFLNPISAFSNMSVHELLELLDQLPWEENPWHAGAWIDSAATAMHFNKKWFNLKSNIETLLGWTQLNVDPSSGLWGKWDSTTHWQLPVNGFYRLTRGLHAQYSLPLPYAEATIDSILKHSRDRMFFDDNRGTCCDVLDVVHPLWLLSQQTTYRKNEIKDLAKHMLERPLKKWTPGRGFSFTLESGSHHNHTPCLKYTEQWLSVIYYLSDLLGKSQQCRFIPKGIHKP
ncbi:MAG: acyltransferase [Lentisphaeria bacterium]|nr:acyltransferase [Lentisphaeria bacterium]